MSRLVEGMTQLLHNARHHPVARRRPLTTLGRIASWQIACRLRPGVHDRHWIEDARLLVERGMTGATGNLYYGLHEFPHMGFLLHFLRPDDLLIDAGANIGTYTLLAAKVVGARVMAFEPHPGTAALLERNVAHNGIADRVAIHRVGLSDQDGAGAITDGLGPENRIVAAGGADTQAITLRRLDDLAADAQPVMLKIDVEGHEPRMLAGALATLARPSLQALTIETVDARVAAILADAGFTERFYDPFTRTLSAQSTGEESDNRLFVRDAAFVADRVRSARHFAVAGLAV